MPRRTPVLLAATLATALSAGLPSVQADAAVGPGRVTVGFPDASSPAAGAADGGASVVAALPDRRTVAVGSVAQKLRVLVVDSAGRPDPSFGSQGELTVPLKGFTPSAALPLPDGRIIVTGGQPNSDPHLLPTPAAFRLTAAGQLDPSYGSGGVATLPGVQKGVGEALAGDGSVFLGGQTGGIGSATQSVGKLTPDGQPDPAFGSGGVAGGGSAAETDALALRTDGSVVVAGAADQHGANATTSTFTPAGQLDPAVPPASLSTPTIGSAQPTPDGGVAILGGKTGGTAPSGAVGITKLTAAGAPDPGFAADGFLDLAGQPIGVDKRLLAGPGDGLTVAGAPAKPVSGTSDGAGAIAVLRLSAAGAVTSATTTPLPFGGGTVFQRGGGTLTQPTFDPTIAGATNIRPDGSLVLAGSGVVAQAGGEGVASGVRQFALASLTPSGALDPAFGGTEQDSISGKIRPQTVPARKKGSMIVELKGSEIALASVRITGHGKLLAAGLGTIYPGQARRVSIPLTLAGVRAVKPRRHVHLKVAVAERDVAGNTASITFTGQVR